MTTNTEQMRTHLQAFDFNSLFVSGLGWNYYRDNPLQITIESFNYVLESVAEKAGFAVFVCAPDANGAIPPYPVRRKIEHQVAQRIFEHLIIFVDESRTSQIWQWVKRETGKPAACREMQYSVGQSGGALTGRIPDIAVSLEEELQGIGITEVVSRVRRAMDIERVTRRFYDRFKGELTAFQSFIEGVTTQGDREWYASLMLNRMMFIYFIQKQGFLDGDINYLRHRLQMVQAQAGEGQYQQFYRMFLRRLFHDGLGKPEAERSPELARLLGKVPFLNGGLFDVHDLERDNPEISIPDEAFERIFDFFDAYQWHLDDRPTGDDNEINPDVLGYIFEKYINQKQMGAYYTKEDITGYITRNTVIPFLFDSAEKECPVAFRPEGGVWRLLQEDPDRYIYPAVGHGMTWNYSPDMDPERLPVALQLPDDIVEGMTDVSLRHGWNAPALDEYALPTETWCEVVARRRRYEEVRAKLAAGEVQSINDLITLNLDIERFARDVIAQSEGPELLRAFWHSLTGVSVLDPTCGSGAFLFAALNILEPLYTTCMEGMKGFLQDLEVSQRPHSPNALNDFRQALDKLEQHPSERYFILKSIVLNNLYGVDIMEEATEICKLRLFLKLVAQLKRYEQIEPLPDIDFNIRAGNALVGFSSLDAVRNAMTVTPGGQHRALFDEDREALALIEQEAATISRTFATFRKQQTELDGGISSTNKAELRIRLDRLRNELDRLLASEYGVDTDIHSSFENWCMSHQPFHWFIEFYETMNMGGFDVVVGNPPYVKTKSLPYGVKFLEKTLFPDIYAYVAIRSHSIISNLGRCGIIVPLSLTFSYEFSELRAELTQVGSHWFSSYDNIPAALFSGAGQRCTIWISSFMEGDSFVSRLYRWRSAYRDSLMENITYSKLGSHIPIKEFGIPRLTNGFGSRLLEIHSTSHSSKQSNRQLRAQSTAKLGFSQTGRNFLATFIEQPPVMDPISHETLDSKGCGWVRLPSEKIALTALAASAGDTFFWYWLTRGDGFHLTSSILNDFLAPMISFSEDHLSKLATLGGLIHEHRYSALVFKKNAGKYVGNYNYQKLRPLTRRADLVLLSGLGASWAESEGLFSFVSLVRSVNSEAGEKNIPSDLREALLQPGEIDLLRDERLREIDQWLSTSYSVEHRQIHEIVSAN